MAFKKAFKKYNPGDYRIQRLIPGGSLGHPDKTLVAIPDHYKGKRINCFFLGAEMTIPEVGKDALTFRVFEDKFHRGKNYTLIYYEWIPVDGDEQARRNYMRGQGLSI